MMRTVVFVTITILLSALLAYVVNLPNDIGLDVPDGKLNSLSFAPFREGQSPLLLQFPKPEQIDEDLRLLADKTHTIRTYSSSAGMKVIPELAQRHGLQMIQGAWIGYLKEDARIEIEALVAAANAYPDVIKRVIVGNEVLLRGERKPEELVEYIREVKQRIKQPVSYADVWSMQIKHPDLIKAVDFITVHVLPYWEDKPIPVDAAPGHIERIYKQVKQEVDAIAPGKPILIGESGWPSEGRQRGWAVPSVVNEAAFILGLLKVAADNSFDVNIVEAFNQSWKSELEGVVGANWGLFSVDREEVFPLTGPVYENTKWLKQFLFASVLMIIIVGCYAKNLSVITSRKLATFLIFVQILCALLIFQADKSWYTSYDNWQRGKTALVILLNIIAGGLLINRAYSLLTDKETPKLVGLALDVVYLIVITLAFYKTYLLAVDGRYISFPFEITSIPLAGIVGLWIVCCLDGKASLSKMRLNPDLLGYKPALPTRNQQIGWLMLFYAAGLVFGEIRAFMVGRDFILEFPNLSERLGWAITYTLTNSQLLAWLAGLLLIAYALLNNSRRF